MLLDLNCVTSIRLCELRKVNVEVDTESDQVPFELDILPLQQLQKLVSTMLIDIKYVKCYFLETSIFK